ncbi:MAG: 30S ribosomal protein S4 [Candidatus Portnoybacteria bacterium]|nr:30S ribosomal protein S4 [Candidatus Portnoybacteria bacterium]
MIDPKCKKCRRAGQKLFLKGERCFGPKCAMVKRPDPPGIHTRSRRKGRGGMSEFGKQLAEKQRVKRIYGILERQFSKYIKESTAAIGDTREILLRKLEMRLDNVVFRLGWAKSRNMARQLVNHGHIFINGKRVDIPSYRVKKDQILTLGSIKESNLMKDLPAALKKYETPIWLSLDKEKLEAKVLSEPSVEELGDLNPIGLVVEFYSR